MSLGLRQTISSVSLLRLAPSTLLWRIWGGFTRAAWGEGWAGRDWAKSSPCAFLEGEKAQAGSLPSGQTKARVTLESEQREGHRSGTASGLGHVPPALF